ncbi:MAG: glycoside hydrolase family 16 protein [Clostridia bacterium]|nr:glycoside hydrolase family 16 protein [Clostridia bacterium]
MDFIAFIKAVAALIMSFFMAILPGGFPRVPDEENLVLSWSDEFDGDALDLTKWEGHYCGSGEAKVRRGSYWHTDTAVIEDGCLHIKTLCYPDGYNGNGKPGWYTCGIDTRTLFEQKYGYFEVRCILPKGEGLWSAFWMLADGMSNVDGSGKDGAEIDIFESPFFGRKPERKVSSNIHIDGYGEGLKSTNVCEPLILVNNPYEDFNTYGLKWTEDEYIFYINGIETGRSSFGGASQVPEYLILSVEVGGTDAVPGDSWAGKGLTADSTPTDFIVDYVRAYKFR